MFREALLQSSLWKTFQERNGRTCVTGSFGLGIVEILPMGRRYLYLPRGPIFDALGDANDGVRMRDELSSIAAEQKAGWVRVEPGDEEGLHMLVEMFGEKSIVSAPRDIQPREILVMDITSDETLLLSAMKAKTRYNVRLAEKHGVSIRFSHAEADMEELIELIYATTDRKAISPHPKNYYRNFFQAFDEHTCVIALAEYRGAVLAANLLICFGGVMYYLHGGSSDDGRHLMAPYLLQWESVREAKRRGCSLYDFGGVNTHQNGAQTWTGITRFKQGFAPKTAIRSFPGTYDIVVSVWQYRWYRFLRRLRRLG